MKNHLTFERIVEYLVIPLILIILFFAACTDKARAAEITGYERKVVTQYDRLTESYAIAIDGLQNQIEEMDKRITSLSGENATLKVKISQLEQSKNETPNVTVVSESGNYADLEHRVHVLERVISMMEVKIGSFHSYINELVAPMKKALNLK